MGIDWAYFVHVLWKHWTSQMHHKTKVAPQHRFFLLCKGFSISIMQSSYNIRSVNSWKSSISRKYLQTSTAAETTTTLLVDYEPAYYSYIRNELVTCTCKNTRYKKWRDVCFSPYGVARENLTIQFFIPLFADAAWTVTLLIIHTCTQESQITNRIQSTTLKQINRSQIPPPPPKHPKRNKKKERKKSRTHTDLSSPRGKGRTLGWSGCGGSAERRSDSARGGVGRGEKRRRRRSRGRRRWREWWSLSRRFLPPPRAASSLAYPTKKIKKKIRGKPIQTGISSGLEAQYGSAKRGRSCIFFKKKSKEIPFISKQSRVFIFIFGTAWISFFYLKCIYPIRIWISIRIQMHFI